MLFDRGECFVTRPGNTSLCSQKLTNFLLLCLWTVSVWLQFLFPLWEQKEWTLLGSRKFNFWVEFWCWSLYYTYVIKPKRNPYGVPDVSPQIILLVLEWSHQNVRTYAQSQISFEDYRKFSTNFANCCLTNTNYGHFLKMVILWNSLCVDDLITCQANLFVVKTSELSAVADSASETTCSSFVHNFASSIGIILYNRMVLYIISNSKARIAILKPQYRIRKKLYRILRTKLSKGRNQLKNSTTLIAGGICSFKVIKLSMRYGQNCIHGVDKICAQSADKIVDKYQRARTLPVW